MSFLMPILVVVLMDLICRLGESRRISEELRSLLRSSMVMPRAWQSLAGPSVRFLLTLRFSAITSRP